MCYLFSGCTTIPGNSSEYQVQYVLGHIITGKNETHTSCSAIIDPKKDSGTSSTYQVRKVAAEEIFPFSPIMYPIKGRRPMGPLSSVVHISRNFWLPACD